MKYQITINSFQKNFEIEITEQDELDFISYGMIYSENCSPLFMIMDYLISFQVEEENKKILLIKWLIKHNSLWRLNIQYSKIFLQFYEQNKLN